jgi:hypothetical protein
MENSATLDGGELVLAPFVLGLRYLKEKMMDQKLPTRFWIESALGVLSAACLALTLVWPQWIEAIFGLHPDAGDGSSEWVINSA